MEKEMTTFTTQDRQDAQRRPLTGDLRVNVGTHRSEIYDGGKWVPILEHNKPLTSTEIMNLGDKYLRTAFVPAEALEFARAIERAHGIGE